MKIWYKYIKPYLKSFILGPICMIVEVVGEVIMPMLLASVINLGSAFQSTGDYISQLLDKIANSDIITATDATLQKLYTCFDYLGSEELDRIGESIALNIENGNMTELSGNLTQANAVFGNLLNTPYIWTVIGTAAVMILVALCMLAGGVGGAYFGAKAAINFATDLRSDLFKKVQSFSYSNIDKFSTGSLVTRLTNDVNQLQNFINMLLRMCLRDPGMLIGALIMAISLKPELAAVLLITVPVMMLISGFVIMKGFPKFGKMQTKVDELNTAVQENVTNVRVVKSFVREKYEEEKFSNANRNLKKAGISAQKVMILLNPIVTFAMNITTIAVLWFGGKMVVGSTLEIGYLSSFLTYVTQILMSLTMLTIVLMFSSRAMASAKRIKQVILEKPDISDGNGACLADSVKNGEIEFRNVSFRYFKNSPNPVLNNISLKIPAGKTIGIIGSTGCGKTTLVSMIPRLYDSDEGSVYVDGVNVKDYSLEKLRDGIGMVLQKNTLFSGTVADNLRWGDGNASLEEIRKAASYAQADKFIESTNDGYDKNVDKGGVNFSGGQQQRLCIARALIKKPKILILDDSTSAVDTATEAQIRRALKDELPDTTKIIIAQRVSSVKDADIIVVMNEGMITGVGTHTELMSSNKEYSEIYFSQTDKKEA